MIPRFVLFGIKVFQSIGKPTKGQRRKDKGNQRVSDLAVVDGKLSDKQTC